MSMAVQEPSAPRRISMGPAAALLLPSKGTARPEGMVARNSSSPTHFTLAVGMFCSREFCT